jgi:hypothetical protein
MIDLPDATNANCVKDVDQPEPILEHRRILVVKRIECSFLTTPELSEVRSHAECLFISIRDVLLEHFCSKSPWVLTTDN